MSELTMTVPWRSSILLVITKSQKLKGITATAAAGVLVVSSNPQVITPNQGSSFYFEAGSSGSLRAKSSGKDL